MKNTYIEKVTTGGVDWHDISTTSEFLKQDDKYEIQDPAAVITESVYLHIADMHVEQEGKTIAVLTGIPELDTIKGHIAGKTPFTVKSEDESLTAAWNPEENLLTLSFYHGQLEYQVYYVQTEVEAEDVVYLAIENFLCPNKGFDSVQRFYHAPFESLEEAEAALEAMETHKLGEPPVRVVKELFITGRNQLKNNEWFDVNRQITEILTEHPELDDDRYFHWLAKKHLEILQGALAR